MKVDRLNDLIDDTDALDVKIWILVEIDIDRITQAAQANIFNESAGKLYEDGIERPIPHRRRARL